LVVVEVFGHVGGCLVGVARVVEVGRLLGDLDVRGGARLVLVVPVAVVVLVAPRVASGLIDAKEVLEQVLEDRLVACFFDEGRAQNFFDKLSAPERDEGQGPQPIEGLRRRDAHASVSKERGEAQNGYVHAGAPLTAGGADGAEISLSARLGRLVGPLVVVRVPVIMVVSMGVAVVVPVSFDLGGVFSDDPEQAWKLALDALDVTVVLDDERYCLFDHLTVETVHVQNGQRSSPIERLADARRFAKVELACFADDSDHLAEQLLVDAGDLEAQDFELAFDGGVAER
jgi:hypothetical protein